MPAAVAESRPSRETRRAPQRSRARLRVVDLAARRRRARRRVALALLFVLVVVGLFGVAFVHAQLVESQQDLDDMRGRIAELEAEKARIERAVDEASAPATVVERAAELGMVRAEDPVYLMAPRETGSG